ncbi:peptidoglycan -binding protein [Arenibacterium sp. LLYu02]|uniref:peptidoglycan -binding protein n=1 Tax=Arenibacterium sp. LLYu02 TaxID=3404132 RepID=UPI003B21A537
MALSRRTGQRFQASIWPGFVDAMTGLLLVLMFVLTIFMVVQFVLRETITGQETELDALSSEVRALAQALGVREREANLMQARLGALGATLNTARADLSTAQSRIATLSKERDAANADLAAARTQISDFEAQVAALIAGRDQAAAQIAELTASRDELAQARTELMSEQEALNLALAKTREEVDAQSEAARLAAAKTEALEALIADLRKEEAAQATRVADLESTLSEQEAAKLAEAAAAEALRKRLENADAELTAMTLSLEAERKKAEDTLTLLAAAEVAKTKLDAELATALSNLDEARAQTTASDQEELTARLLAALTAKDSAESAVAEQRTLAEQRADLLAQARAALSSEKAVSEEARRETALLNQQVAALREQLGGLQALLDDFKDRDSAQSVQLQNLGQDLNSALARAAAEERRRRLLEEQERKRLEAERAQLASKAEDLERYRSEFFGQLREVLGNQEGVRIEGDRFVFASEVLFALGSAQLSETGKEEIAKVARILQTVAAAIPSDINWIIRVDGHTDNQPFFGTGKYADNWELSQGRALSVVRYMIDALGLPPDRLAANGFGEFQPINPEDTPEARAQNRRIELKLTER